jgi:hypothetical protein
MPTSSMTGSQRKKREEIFDRLGVLTYIQIHIHEL